MKSNATLLTFLTISEANEEKIFFGYMKELEEIAPSNPHWYKGRGSNGEASYLWEEKKLKQWAVIANDEFIKTLFAGLSSKFELNIELGSTTRRFTIPVIEKKIVTENIYAIPGLDTCDRGDVPEDYTCKSWHTDWKMFNLFYWKT